MLQKLNFVLVFLFFFPWLTEAEDLTTNFKPAKYLSADKSIFSAPLETKDNDLQKLTKAKFSSIRRVILSNTKITDEGLSFLTHLPLIELRLDGTTVSNKGIQTISKIQTLRILSLSNTGISDHALVLLKNLPLKELYLNNTTITNAAFAALKNSNLRTLYFADTLIGDSGLRNLPKNTLKNLNFSKTRVSDLSVPFLLEMNLTKIYLSGSHISSDGRSTLKSFGIKLDT